MATTFDHVRSQESTRHSLHYKQSIRNNYPTNTIPQNPSRTSALKMPHATTSELANQPPDSRINDAVEEIKNVSRNYLRALVTSKADEHAGCERRMPNVKAPRQSIRSE